MTTKHGPGGQMIRRAACFVFHGFLVGFGVLWGTANLRAQTVREFPIPTTNRCEIGSTSGPVGITTGPDGNLWFTEVCASQIGRITPDGMVTEFPLRYRQAGPQDITTGSDGNLWFNEGHGRRIGRITPTGTVTEFPIPSGSVPLSITSGPDGSLWFTEIARIGRVTTAGVFTEFSLPNPNAFAQDITKGPDGNLWFTEYGGNKIGRITVAGDITEFDIPTDMSDPNYIAAGPDGNLWFTEANANQIGRITPTGVITEFPYDDYREPMGIASGADGNLWFWEAKKGMIGRITPDGALSHYPIPSLGYGFYITAGPDRSVWFTEYDANKIGRITTGPAVPRTGRVDAFSETVGGSDSNRNGVLEAGETVTVAPAWANGLPYTWTFSGTATDFTGPQGPTYTVVDSAADYGTLNPNVGGNCFDDSGNCYRVAISGARPAAHWDAAITETLDDGLVTKVWTLHVGESFSDVPVSQPFYAAIENLFHHGITGGCGAGAFCPSGLVTRAQMAAVLMKTKMGTASAPPPASGRLFGDVPETDPFAAWIEQLAGFGITGGCSPDDYCPTRPVRRDQMAVFLLKARHGSAFTPPACSGVFADVPCPSPYADWIEELYHEGVAGGCGGGNYCPSNPTTRGEMAALVVKTFGLELYEP